MAPSLTIKAPRKTPFLGTKVQNKFLRLSEGILPSDRLHHIIDRVEKLDREDDISGLVGLMVSEKKQS